MIYVIAYDVELDIIRNRISKFLCKYGIRVQKSVFECKIADKDLEKFLFKLQKLVTDGVNIRIYPMCIACYSKAVGFGELKQLPGLKGYEIV